VEIDGKKADLKMNDAIIIPAGASQRISNHSDEDLVFYCLCEPRFLPDCYENLEG
jgi:mannose-6-phosphate isomerase-like protein (cupin superfamily)